MRKPRRQADNTIPGKFQQISSLLHRLDTQKQHNAAGHHNI